LSNSIKLLTVIGARPQFIKAATVSRAVRVHNNNVQATGQGTAIHEVICHTGQHFDANMSDVFFDQMDIPRPDHHLGIANLSHGAMTGRMCEGIEALIQRERPDWLLVYGDTNSTLAGALAAAKLKLPVAHVEAGLRSHNPAMPEEINRVLTDRISTLLLCPTTTAVSNLEREGFPYPTTTGETQRIENVGDVMYDAVLYYRDFARTRISLDTWGLDDQGYAVCTLHRQENTDDPERLNGILAALRAISRELPVVLPLHPRTRQRLERENQIADLDGLTLIDPLPYLEMQRLQISAQVILTDSGGMQKEAYFHGVPCITFREETEWLETVECGWNQLVGADMDRIFTAFLNARRPTGPQSTPYGHGNAAQHILAKVQ
jgi:UDP-GlcNAc3NAcA epimerase